MHLEESMVDWMLGGFGVVTAELAQICNLDEATVHELLEIARNHNGFKDILSRAGIAYRAPCVIHGIEFPDEHFDLFFYLHRFYSEFLFPT